MQAANHAPIYAACLYPELAESFRTKGWALAVHGSLARDFELGFVDNEDDEYPGAIWHKGINQVFDISATDPKEIIQVVFARGKEIGDLEAKDRVRAAFGF